MDRFKALQTFLDVAKSESLSAVAREEGVTPAMVGRRIDQLEADLGVKLFKRSTRKITLTPEGVSFHEDVRNILNELRAAEESLSVGARSATGRLILTAPTAFGRKHIAPHLPAFVAAHPNLSVTLALSERIVDLKNERVDLAIRIADLKNADLIAVRLARNHRVVVASPAYLKRHGRPSVLADLARHNCLITATEAGLADSWTFREEGSGKAAGVNTAVKVAGHLQCNDGEVLTRWALEGHGLAWRSAWEVSEEIDKGRLVEVLGKFAAPGNDIYAVYSDRKFLPAKVKLFIDFIKQAFGDPPYWEPTRK
ncbi:MAG: LysR family transcriptional regulator [Betaproteobacteria bacterium]|nr:LysR family transcriptional regulator [Betaproteobacteria bacterium]